MSKKKILVVDDNDEIRDLMAGIFESLGYEAVQASNGKVALEILETESHLPTAIILDLMMPVMNGESFLEARPLSPRIEIHDIPVIIFTAQGNNETVTRLGKDYPVVHKPARAQDFLTIIDGLAEAK